MLIRVNTFFFFHIEIIRIEHFYSSTILQIDESGLYDPTL